MTRQSPYVITLSSVDRAVLEQRSRAYTARFATVVRAKIVLLAADGEQNTKIAHRLGVHVEVVSTWRKRFFESGLAGLDDRPGRGRPRSFTPEVVAEVKAMACEPPTQREVPLSRWSSVELAAQAVAEGLVVAVSASTVRRWLHEDAIKPWQHRSWIFPRDPDFAVKAARVLDLYQRIWQGTELSEHEYVISADEKSQLQALHRRHPGRPTGPGHPRQVEFEYRRGGTLAYFAAYDIHQARVLGTIAPKTGIEPFTELVSHVMTREPYASARRVFWVVDNGSSHAGQASIDRMSAAWPTATLVHLPIHASWLNQVEIYFSVLQRKAINPIDFPDLDALTERILAFQDRYNQTAAPFDWTFTRRDLHTMLDRIGPTEQTTPTPTAA